MLYIKKVFFIFLIIPYIGFGQEHEQTVLYLYVSNKNSKAVKYSINEDNSKASFSLYRKGFETKKKRDSINQIYLNKEDVKNGNYKIPQRPLPQKSINFYAVEKPEILTSINNIQYITTNELIENESSYLMKKKIYIILKHNDERYLKWKVEIVPYE